MSKTRNASATMNGFLFQINVAIYLMIKYINEIQKIRVEGFKEDIELFFSNNNKIMVQVKSQWENLETKNNVMSKLESSLTSLSEADADNVKALMYISNLPDPLNNEDIEFTTYHGVTLKKYSELKQESKDVVDKKVTQLLNSKNIIFNKDKLWIIRIPFYGEDDNEKHKFIYEIVKEFIDNINNKISYKKFVCFWESKFLRNGSSNPKIYISKHDISNYLILSSIEGYDASSDYDLINADEDDYEEAYEKYSDFIEEKQDCYEAICKVNSLYERTNKRTKVTKEDFVKNEKIILYDYFFNSNKKSIKEFSPEEILDMLVAQIISYVILRKRSIIKRINERMLK